MADRLRMIDLTCEQYDDLVRQSGGLEELGRLVGERAGVPDLAYHSSKPNGVRMKLYVTSSTFAEVKCKCLTPLWAPTLGV